MSFLKNIPVHYKGELHDVRLINFSIDKHEVLRQVPKAIKVRDFDGRAMISMVDVKLKRMHPVSLPFLRFNYRHVAFRLLVDDSAYNQGAAKGIFFFRSFTDKPLIVAGGKLMTDYNLEAGDIEEVGHETTLTQGRKHVKYCLGEISHQPDPELKDAIGALDRAYSLFGAKVRVTAIQREKWPIQQVDCTCFENTFFQTAKFVGAFRVFETIYYEWLPPKVLQP